MIQEDSKIKLENRLKAIKPSATLAINEKSKQLQDEGRKVFRFGLGQSPFPVPRTVEEALSKNAHQKDYLNTKGLKALRLAVAEYHKRNNGLHFSEENIQIGPGSKELIYDILLALDAKLLLASPSWVSYEPQGRLANKALEWINCTEDNNWKISPNSLNQICSSIDNQKILLLNYPNNPTGQTYSKQELQDLALVARKNQVIIISDEIYGALSFDQHHSIAEFYPEGTIVTAGLSKWCGAGGWRLGTAAFPDSLNALVEYMSIIASETYTSVSAPIQYAAVSAFSVNPELDIYVNNSVNILKLVAQYCYESLHKTGLSTHAAHGGFYLFVNADPFKASLINRGIKTSNELVEDILDKTGVALLPGSDFGRPKTEFTFRLAYVDFDGKSALKSIEQNFTTGEFIEKCCPNIKSGIEKLCAYFS
jgi:aspartate aminotransferase